MRTVFVLAALLSFAATAATEIRTIDVFQNDIELSKNVKNISLDHMDFQRPASKIKIVDVPCNSDDINCTQTITLERTDAVRVRVSYDDGSFTEDTSNWLEIYLPVSLFSAQDLATIKAHTRNFDLLGRHGRVLRSMMNRLIKLTVTKVQREISVVDEQRSYFCDSDSSGCEQRLVYKPAVGTFKNVNVSLK